jgi:CHRD domain
MRVRSTLLPLAVVAALALSTLLAATVSAGGRPFNLTLSGAAERPTPGDPDGTGTATIWFNPGLGQVCYDYSVSGVVLPLGAAHIHVATADVAGPVVIPLPPTRPDGGTGCVSADRSLILAIFGDPAGYYFNVHNAEFPAGALRAQLG